jgi:hypothetical protein
MLHSARRRAKEGGAPFALALQDLLPLCVPRCPVLGIPLDYVATTGKLNDASATLDRFVAGRGYVPGNIAVISFRAKRIKHAATLEQMRALVAWLRRVCGNAD